MIFDEPVTLEGKETQYGSMEENARRGLTEEEVRWNTKFIKQEAVEQRRGFALAATPSTPALATPSWRAKRRVAADAAPMHADSRQGGRSFRTKKKASGCNSRWSSISIGVWAVPVHRAPSWDRRRQSNERIHFRASLGSAIE